MGQIGRLAMGHIEAHLRPQLAPGQGLNTPTESPVLSSLSDTHTGAATLKTGVVHPERGDLTPPPTLP